MWLKLNCLLDVTLHILCRAQLPVKIDIIKHPNETDGKSTAIHAKILAPSDVTIYTYPCIPDYEKDEVSCFSSWMNGVFIFFPPITFKKKMYNTFECHCEAVPFMAATNDCFYSQLICPFNCLVYRIERDNSTARYIFSKAQDKIKKKRRCVARSTVQNPKRFNLPSHNAKKSSKSS